MVHKNEEIAKTETAEGAQGNGQCTIYIMGKKYKVPATLTILKAIEYSGYSFVRGCGCRGGICGACGTVYRTPDDFRLKVGLACQTVVEDGMHLAQIPFFPVNKAVYDLDELEATGDQLKELYPELMRCVSCNSCRRICPQDLEVMEYMAAAMRGDLAKVAHLSFECIMCGLCAARCPAETMQYNVALLARRLYGRYILPQAPDLKSRVAEIEAGKYDDELANLVGMDKAELAKMYEEIQADREPD